jgi:hypothetical protein
MRVSRSPVGSRAGGFFALALAMLGLCFLVLPSTSVPSAPAAVPLPGEAAMQAYIDPQTGELTTSAFATAKSADAELEAMLSRSTEGLHEVVYPDGSVGVNLQGRFQRASVAIVGADGRLRTSCFERAAQAEAFLHGRAPQPKQPELEVR